MFCATFGTENRRYRPIPHRTARRTRHQFCPARQRNAVPTITSNSASCRQFQILVIPRETFTFRKPLSHPPLAPTQAFFETGDHTTGNQAPNLSVVASTALGRLAVNLANESRLSTWSPFSGSTLNFVEALVFWRARISSILSRVGIGHFGTRRARLQ